MQHEAGNAVPGPRRKAEERRGRIVAAARRLFVRQGFHNTGMAQIARESDVLVGQIYRDFQNKEDLIGAIITADLSTLFDDPSLYAALAAHDVQGLRDWIVGVVVRSPDEDDRRLFSDIVAEAARNTRAAAILNAAHESFQRRIGIALEVLAPGAARAAARAQAAEFILALSGAILHRHVCRFGGAHDVLLGRFAALAAGEIDRLQSLPA